MTANFSQTDARGRCRGHAELKRPGKVRFQYGSGDLLLVADGKTPDLHRLSGRAEVELAARPHAARRPAVRLARPQGHARRSCRATTTRVVVVRARERRRNTAAHAGLLRSASAPGGLQLYGWTAIDAQNNRTTVKLSNVRFNVAVPDSAFTYAEPKKKRVKIVSYCDLFIARVRRASLNRQLRSCSARGFPLLPGSAGSLA